MASLEMKQIRKHFEQTFELTDEDWLIFSSKLVKQEFPKKHILLNAGQIENHLSFVEKGILRFYISGAEKDLTFSFAFDNEFVSAYDSFLTKQPSIYTVETLSPTTLWRLSFEDRPLS